MIMRTYNKYINPYMEKILNNEINGKIKTINDDGTLDIVEKETLCVRRVNIGDLTCQAF